MFKDILNKILLDLNNAEHVNADELFKNIVQNKLDNSNDTFCNNLQKNYDYLLSRDNLKVLKNVKKLKAKEEKEKKLQEEGASEW